MCDLICADNFIDQFLALNLLRLLYRCYSFKIKQQRSVYSGHSIEIGPQWLSSRDDSVTTNLCITYTGCPYSAKITLLGGCESYG